MLHAAGNMNVTGLDVLVLTDGTPPVGTPTLAPITPPTPTVEPTVPRVCGDGILQTDVGEVCDMKSFATTCENQGYLFGGRFQCSADCMSVDTFSCFKVLKQVSFQSVAVVGESITGSYLLDHAADVVEVRIIGGLGDADLYVQWGTSPTTTNYDCRSGSASNFETCTFHKPTKGATVHFRMVASTPF